MTKRRALPTAVTLIALVFATWMTITNGVVTIVGLSLFVALMLYQIVVLIKRASFDHFHHAIALIFGVTSMYFGAIAVFVSDPVPGYIGVGSGLICMACVYSRPVLEIYRGLRARSFKR